jgi:hypothetical protein
MKKTTLKMKFKNTIALFFSLFLISNFCNLKAQNFILPGDTNFAQIAARNSTITPDNTFDGTYMQWKRFEGYWQPRLAPSGSFKNFYTGRRYVLLQLNRKQPGNRC